MNILIAGNGKVGSTLTKQLAAEGHDLTIIDSNPDVLSASVERYDVMSVHGNCASAQTLRDAGVAKADLLIALAGQDEINLLTCMTAHCLNPRLHTIARIRDPDYREQAYDMRDSFALSLIVNPERQAAAEIGRLLQYPGFLRRDTFARGNVEIVELRIDADSKLRDVALMDLGSIVHCKVLVCAVLRDGRSIAPAGSFVLKEGDRVFVTAPTANLSLLLRSLGLITRKVRKVLLAGGDKVSFYLAAALQKNVSITLIERDERRCLSLAAQLPEVNVVLGDAGNQDLLASEGLGQCDAFVTLTGLDELNILLSLYAKQQGVPQVITKLGHMADNPLLLDTLPLGSQVCPRELCASTILRYVRAMQNQTGAAVALHKIADGQAEAIEFIADENTLHCGEALKDIHLRPNILIVSITRGSRTEIPGGLSSFQKGDSIVVVTTGDTVLHQLNDIFA